MSEAENRGTGAATPHEDAERAKERLKAEKKAAGDLAQDAREAAGSMAERAKNAAIQQGEEARDHVAGHLRAFTDAVRHAGDEYAEKQPGPVSDLVRQATHGLEEFAQGIGRRSPSEMLDVVRDFGRRSPVAFLAGSLLAGFALARFATSSGGGGRRGRYGGDYGGGDYGRRAEPGFDEGLGGYESGRRGPAYSAAGAGAAVGGTGVYQTGTSAAPTTSPRGTRDVRGGTTVGSGPAIPSGGGTTGSGAIGGSAAGLSGQTQTESERWSTNRPDPDMKRDI